MLIASQAKTQQQAQAIGMLIYFPSSFLGGMFIPINVIHGNAIMNAISYVLPFRYSTGLMTTS
jgi:ABC-type multidrug transport system permease subunit